MNYLIITGKVKNRDIIEKAIHEQLDMDALITRYGSFGEDINIYVSYNGEDKRMNLYAGSTRSNRKKFGSMKTIKNQLHDTICECPSILALEEKTYGLAKELLSEDDFKEECDKSHTIFHVQNKGIIKRNELPKIAKYEQPDFYEHMLDLGTPETTKMLKMGIFERETGKLLRFITNYENNIEEIIGMGINNDIYSSSEFKSFFDLDMETWENLTINKHNLLDLVEKQFGFNISKPYTYRVLTKTVEVPDYMDVEAMTSLIDVQRFFVKIRSYMNARSMLGFSNDESEKKYGKVVDTVVNQLVDAFCPKKNNRKKSKTC